MALTLNGSGTITGLQEGGIEDAKIIEADIKDKAVSVSKLKDGTDGELITWNASGVAETVAVGTSGHYLKSNGAGAKPSFAAVSTTDTKPFRNLIINGAMNVHQRIATGTMQTGTSGYTADRWRWWDGTGGVFTWGQVTESPAGFRHSHLVDCAISGSPSGDEYSAILYKVEANDLTHLKYNTSDAQSLTLSFWVRSNLTGDWAVSLRKKEGTDRNITKTYTINAANTWEKKTITFPGDTSGGGIDMSDDGINEGLRITFCAQAGANNKGGTGEDSWHNYTANKWFEGHTVDLGSSASNDWYITGVQLEVGTTATDFEHRAYGDELQRCKRYFQRLNVSAAGEKELCMGLYETGSVVNTTIWFHPEMRSTPTGTVGSGTDWYHIRRDSANDTFNDFALFSATKTSAMFRTTSNVSGTAGMAGLIRTLNAGATLDVQSEV